MARIEAAVKALTHPEERNLIIEYADADGTISERYRLTRDGLKAVSVSEGEFLQVSAEDRA